MAEKVRPELGATAQSPTGSGLSPKDVVERLWKEATEGELLSPDGWNRASRFFVQHEAFPEDSAVRIVSNNWGIEHSSVSNDTAEVVLEYWEAGDRDGKVCGMACETQSGPTDFYFR